VLLQKKAITILRHVWESSLQSAGNSPSTLLGSGKALAGIVHPFFGHQISNKEMNGLKKP